MNPQPSIWKAVEMIVTYTAVTVAICGGIAFFLSRNWKSAERMAVDATFRRRCLYWFAFFYAAGLVVATVNLISDGDSPVYLIGGIIPLFIAWNYLRAARKTDVAKENSSTQNQGQD